MTAVNLIHRREIAHALKEDRRLHHFLDGTPRSRQDRLNIPQNPLRLCRHVARNELLIRGSIEICPEVNTKPFARIACE